MHTNCNLMKCFRSFSDEESQIEVQMTEVLEEMRKLNVTFSTDIEGTFKCLWFLYKQICFRMGPVGQLDGADQSSVRQSYCPEAHDKLYCEQ